MSVWQLKKLTFEWGLVVHERTVKEWYGNKKPTQGELQNWIIDNDSEGKYRLNHSVEM
jgi:hypothetical protein